MGWLDQVGIRLIQLSLEVEVELIVGPLINYTKCHFYGRLGRGAGEGFLMGNNKFA